MGYNSEFAKSMCVDIETVASPSVEEILDPVHAPKHFRDPHKIAVYQIDKMAERIATASLEPDLCEVVAIGFDNGVEQVVSRHDMDEAEMLKFFWSHAGDSRFVGFNVLKFDLPVLIRRSQLLNVPHPTINIDRYRTPHVDLLEKLSFNGLIPYRSLGFYCRRFQIECSDDLIHGHEIPGLVAEGNWPAVVTHCLADVQKTKLLAQRLGLLSPVAA